MKFITKSDKVGANVILENRTKSGSLPNILHLYFWLIFKSYTSFFLSLSSTHTHTPAHTRTHLHTHIYTHTQAHYENDIHILNPYKGAVVAERSNSYNSYIGQIVHDFDVSRTEGSRPHRCDSFSSFRSFRFELR
jgi:hypothetical protein